MIAAGCPYPGLRPFEESESALFFGREEQVDELLFRLQTTRFLAVVGPSGCGKSSLVRAGMIPALKTGFIAPAGPRWRFADMRPGARPLARLAKALVEKAGLLADEPDPGFRLAEVGAMLRRGPLGMLDLLREAPLPPDSNLLVLVDQFEEIFRFRREVGRDEADAFLSLLLHSAAQEDEPIYVVLTMRSDFFGDCALFTGLPEALNRSQYLTPRLTRDQRESAIVEPAQMMDGDVDPDLVARLLNDMGSDPDQLPVLQHLLMRMWTRTCTDGACAPPAAGAPPRILTLADYDAVGGFRRALSNHADEALGELDARHQEIAEVMFRRLSEREADGRDVRRPTRADVVKTLAGCDLDDVRAVAEAFRTGGRNFLTPPPSEPIGDSTVLDISHESLIRQWAKLREWAATEFRSAEDYRELTREARRWNETGRPDWRLRRGTDLAQALEWQERERPSAAWAEAYGGDFALTMAFLNEAARRKAAEEAEEQAKREAEEAHRQEELHRAHEQAEREAARARERAAEAKRFRRVARIAFAAALLAVGGLVGAGFAWWDSKREESKSLVTIAQDELRRGDVRGALESAHYALPDPTLPVRPLVDAARRELLKALFLPFSQPLSRTFEEGPVLSASFAPGGDQIVTTAQDGTVRLFQRTENPSGGPPWKGEVILSGLENLRSAVFTPDGSSVLVRLFMNGYVLYNPTSSRKDTKEVTGWAAGISPDGRHLAMISRERGVSIVDLHGPKEQAEFSYTKAVLRPFSPAIFSPDGKAFAIGTEKGDIRIWRDWAADPQSEGTVLPGPRSASGKDTNLVFSAAFDRPGHRLIAGYDDRTARIWDLDHLAEAKLLRGHSLPVTSVEFSRDGSRAVTASRDGTIRVWDTTDGHTVAVLKPPGESSWLPAASFDPTDSDRILFGGSFARRAFLFDLKDAARTAPRVVRVSDPTPSEPQAPTAVAMAGNPKASVPASRRVLRDSPEAPLGVAASAAVFSPDGTILVTTAGDGTARVWDARTFAELRPPFRHTAPLYTAAVATDGGRILVGAADGSVFLWNWREDPEPKRLAEAHAGPVTSAAFDTSGRRFLTSSMDGTVRVWNTAEGRVERSLPHGRLVYSAAWNPEGDRVVTAACDRMVRVWDQDAPKTTPPLTFSVQSRIRSARFTPDGRVITASHDDTVRLWSLAKPEQPVFQDIVARSGAPLRDAVPSPDSRQVLTVWGDNTARVYDVDSKDELFVLYGFGDEIESAAWDPAGTRIAAASKDGSVSVWERPTELSAALALADRILAEPQ